MSAHLPLRDRHGSVRAHAVVDAEDVEWLSRWRWGLHVRGYVVRPLGRQSVLMHRELLGLEHGDGLEGDHRNGDRLDNRRENLRVASHAENGQNIRRAPRSSSHRGVCWDKALDYWRAYAQLNGKQHHLGLFASERDAADAARAFRAAHMPYSTT